MPLTVGKSRRKSDYYNSSGLIGSVIIRQCFFAWRNYYFFYSLTIIIKLSRWKSEKKSQRIIVKYKIWIGRPSGTSMKRDAVSTTSFTNWDPLKISFNPCPWLSNKTDKLLDISSTPTLKFYILIPRPSRLSPSDLSVSILIIKRKELAPFLLKSHLLEPKLWDSRLSSSRAILQFTIALASNTQNNSI